MKPSVDPVATRPRFSPKAFILTCLIVGVWINLSEVFRYFAFVMPMTRKTLSMVPNVAPMNGGVFFIWGGWDTILTVMTVWVYWLHAERFGATNGTAVLAGTSNWLLLFVLFWIAMFNMRLAGSATLAVALPLAWLELVVAGLIAGFCFRRWQSPTGDEVL